MGLSVTCRACGRSYDVPLARAGQTGRCACGNLVPIPRDEASLWGPPPGNGDVAPPEPAPDESADDSAPGTSAWDRVAAALRRADWEHLLELAQEMQANEELRLLSALLTSEAALRLGHPQCSTEVREVLQGASREAWWTLDAALERMRKSVALSEETVFLQLQGRVLCWLKDYAGAGARGLMAADRSPNDPFSYLIEGDAHRYGFEEKHCALGPAGVEAGDEGARGRIDLAIESYSKAIALDPSNCSFLLARGTAFYDVSAFDRALADWRQAVGLNPDHATAWLNLGSALMRLGQKEQAVRAWQRGATLGATRTGPTSMSQEAVGTAGP